MKIPPFIFGFRVSIYIYIHTYIYIYIYIIFFWGVLHRGSRSSYSLVSEATIFGANVQETDVRDRASWNCRIEALVFRSSFSVTIKSG